MPSCSWHRSLNEAPNRLWSPSSFSSLTSSRSTNMVPKLQTQSDLYFFHCPSSNGLWACIPWCPLHLEILRSSFKKRHPTLWDIYMQLCFLKGEFPSQPCHWIFAWFLLLSSRDGCWACPWETWGHPLPAWEGHGMLSRGLPSFPSENSVMENILLAGFIIGHHSSLTLEPDKEAFLVRHSESPTPQGKNNVGASFESVI